MRRVPLLLGAALLVALTGCSQTPPRAAVDERPTIYCVGTEDPSGGCVPPPAPADGVAGDADDADDADDASDEDEAPAEERPAPKGPAVQRTFAWADVDDWTPCLAFVRGLSPRAALQQAGRRAADPARGAGCGAAVRRPGTARPGGRGPRRRLRRAPRRMDLDLRGRRVRVLRPRPSGAHGGARHLRLGLLGRRARQRLRPGPRRQAAARDRRARPRGRHRSRAPQERGLDWEDGLSAALAVQHRITGTPAHQPDWYERHATVAVGWLG
ncbi:hypothetical protein GCM10025868_41210 [Angustibacter aerolatus]|uniref:Uncharacterized protein n=1 Tax=Angustibacter aerolatus TaxID=1162965 RepID=A0ABQ6JKV3_9ACTN|nr:hypothetical protein [Angustibacter aerolatus]GMA88871.1 hypothetical protein GCM10025868_41210 [Angustibacter aerolatus]